MLQKVKGFISGRTGIAFGVGVVAGVLIGAASSEIHKKAVELVESFTKKP